MRMCWSANLVYTILWWIGVTGFYLFQCNPISCNITLSPVAGTRRTHRPMQCYNSVPCLTCCDLQSCVGHGAHGITYMGYIEIEA